MGKVDNIEYENIENLTCLKVGNWKLTKILFLTFNSDTYWP